MSHPYFFVDKNSVTPESVFLKGEDLNHLVRVLRARAGDIVEISDNETKRYKTVLAGINKDEAVLQIKQACEITKKPYQISLFMCVLKKEAMEFAIQKTVEIGVDRIIPVISARTVVEIEEKKSKDKVTRWQQIALSASKQCKRDFVCEITGPLDLGSINVSEYDLFFLPAEDLYPGDGEVFTPELKSGAGTLKDVARALNDMVRMPGGGPRDKNTDKKTENSIACIVGPEGGFEKKEILDLVKKGAVPINFGANILRAETASIYFISILDYLLKT